MVSDPRAAAVERTIDANGVPIALTEFPNPGAPPVLLLHGIGSRGSSWWPVIDPLAAQFHLYQLDLRGHGASGKPERGYVVEDYAADLDAVLDALDLDAPRLLGHSLGALVTLYWASKNPTRAAALVLEDPPLRTPPDILQAFAGWQQLAAMTPAQAAAWYRQEFSDWSEEDCLRRAETITSVAPGVFARDAGRGGRGAGRRHDRPHANPGRREEPDDAPARQPRVGRRGRPRRRGTVPTDRAACTRRLPP